MSKNFLLIFIYSLLLVNFSHAEQVYVQIKSAKLRTAPKAFAPGIFDVSFGDSLNVESKNAGWVKVTSAQGVDGYIHESAVTQRKIVLSSQQLTLADVAVDESQVYLAGKGFNDDVEKYYANNTQEFNYKAVDEMILGSAVNDKKLLSFAKSGQLNF